MICTHRINPACGIARFLSRFARRAGLVHLRQTFVLRCHGDDGWPLRAEASSNLLFGGAAWRQARDNLVPLEITFVRTRWKRRIQFAGLGFVQRKDPEQHDELSALHSITSSARASNVVGTSRPSVLAVLRLITISYFVGACTGSSAGFSPLRMRST